MESIFSKNDISVIESLWNLILPIKSDFTDSFYTKLFSMDRTLRSMFKTDLGVQGIRLTDTLNFIISHMKKIEDTIPTIKELGVRHIHYQTKPEHYEIVLDAMLETFDKHLGEEFTHIMRICWIKLYKFLSELMMLAKPSN